MSVYAVVMTLFLVMDPIGNIPLFLVLLRRYSTTRYMWIIIRESIIAWGILCTFAFFGRAFLDGLHIGEAALNMAGGIILLVIAIKMIFPGADQEQVVDTATEPLIVPLAVPLIAGPSALAAVLLLASDLADHRDWVVAGVTIATVLCVLILLSARLIKRLVGERVLSAVARLMGMILTTIAVQMFLDGIRLFMQQSA
jgi:multiple antibiotic resistance protein